MYRYLVLPIQRTPNFSIIFSKLARIRAIIHFETSQRTSAGNWQNCIKVKWKIQSEGSHVRIVWFKYRNTRVWVCFVRLQALLYKSWSIKEASVGVTSYTTMCIESTESEVNESQAQIKWKRCEIQVWEWHIRVYVTMILGLKNVDWR